VAAGGRQAAAAVEAQQRHFKIWLSGLVGHSIPSNYRLRSKACQIIAGSACEIWSTGANMTKRLETGRCSAVLSHQRCRGEPFWICFDHDDDCRPAVGGPLNLWIGYRPNEVTFTRGTPKTIANSRRWYAASAPIVGPRSGMKTAAFRTNSISLSASWTCPSGLRLRRTLIGRNGSHTLQSPTPCPELTRCLGLVTRRWAIPPIGD
jgi:hypothetical protein